MAGATVLFVLFAILTVGGGTTIAYRLRGLRSALATAGVLLAFFGILYWALYRFVFTELAKLSP